MKAGERQDCMFLIRKTDIIDHLARLEAVNISRNIEM